MNTGLTQETTVLAETALNVTCRLQRRVVEDTKERHVLELELRDALEDKARAERRIQRCEWLLAFDQSENHDHDRGSIEAKAHSTHLESWIHRVQDWARFGQSQKHDEPAAVIH